MKKICIITGGASGIGRCITEKFIEDGNFAIVIDTDKSSGEWLLQKYGSGSLMFYCGDITEQKVIDEFVMAITNRFEKVNVLVNNACINKGGLSNCSYDDFNYVLRLGVTAPFYLTKLLTPYFDNDASIVNISSTRAFMSQPNTESYTAAKGGIAALTHAISITLAGKARVNSISPGWIDTSDYKLTTTNNTGFSKADNLQQPVGRVGNPCDIADMVMFLCSDKAGFITGENITVDGGMTKQMIYHDDNGWQLMP